MKWEVVKTFAQTSAWLRVEQCSRSRHQSSIETTTINRDTERNECRTACFFVGSSGWATYQPLVVCAKPPVNSALCQLTYPRAPSIQKDVITALLEHMHFTHTHFTSGWFKLLGSLLAFTCEGHHPRKFSTLKFYRDPGHSRALSSYSAEFSRKLWHAWFLEPVVSFFFSSVGRVMWAWRVDCRENSR